LDDNFFPALCKYGQIWEYLESFSMENTASSSKWSYKWCFQATHVALEQSGEMYTNPNSRDVLSSKHCGIDTLPETHIASWLATVLFKHCGWQLVPDSMVEEQSPIRRLPATVIVQLSTGHSLECGIF
jgi:hypothetical protein